MAKREFPAGQTEFVAHVVKAVDYWNTIAGPTQQQRLYGLAFSIMGALDSASPDLPGYTVRPLTHKNKQRPDIAGDLHERFTALAELAGLGMEPKLPKTLDLSDPQLLGTLKIVAEAFGGKKRKPAVITAKKHPKPAAMTPSKRNGVAVR